MPMLLLHALQAHYLNPVPENLADGVRVSPCHGFRIVLRSLVPVHVVAHFCPGPSLPKFTAREHELAASASHLKLPVKIRQLQGVPQLIQPLQCTQQSRSRINTTPSTALQQPVLLLRAPLSRGGLCRCEADRMRGSLNGCKSCASRDHLRNAKQIRRRQLSWPSVLIQN